MNSRINIAMTSLAVLWIMTGVVFGSLSLVGAAPAQHAAHALGHAHVLSMASAHG
jgi:hypothetical protein